MPNDMVTMSPGEALGIEEFSLEPENALTKEQLSALGTWPKSLVREIRNGTASIDVVEDYLRKNSVPSRVKGPLLGFLFAQKSRLSSRDDRAEEAVTYAEQALAHDDGSPANWLTKGAALLRLQRLDEAIGSFEAAYLCRDRFGAQMDLHLPMLLKFWSGGALLYGLSGIIGQDVAVAQRGVEAYLRVLDEAKIQALESAVMLPIGKVTGDSVPPDLQAALEELALMVRLLSIEDPFEGWREFTKEISKVWPKDVSAVEAIREQRD